MSKKRLRLKKFRYYIEFLDNSADMQGNVRFVGALHSLYDDGWLDWIYLYAKEQAERVQMLKKWDENERNIAEKAQNRADGVEKQNKRYRELLTSKSMKQLIRLEDKGCFLPDEGREGFLDLKYAIEALEGDE